MKRTPIKRGRRTRRTPEQVAAAMLWHRDTFAHGYLIRAASEQDAPFIADVQAHHLIPQQTLRRQAHDLGLDEDKLVWDARIGVPMSKRRHERHHAGVEPFTWDEIPERHRYFAQRFAVEYGLEPWLERHVPGYPGGASVTAP